jgi:hypothetical protein
MALPTNSIKNALGSVANAVTKAASDKASSIKNTASSMGSGGSSGGSSGGNSVTIPSGGNTTTGNRTWNAGADGNAPSGTQIGDTVHTAGGDYRVVAPGTAGATYNPASGLWSTKINSGNAGGSKTWNVGADGNAPAGTKIGDTVVTAGGNYKVVRPGTAGATYNPATGLWSLRISTGPYGSYNSIGSYHDANVSASDTDIIKSLQQQYELAKARGDKTTMDRVHTAAEEIRSAYGYSGGNDGSQYLPLKQEEDTLNKIGLPTYQPQVEYVNNLYEAQKDKALAALQSSYDKSRMELENAMKEIPGTYQAQANQIAAEALKQQQNFNESAAYTGMNAGNGSQAALAMGNQLQSNMSTLRTNEANALTKVQQQLSSLYVEYQNSIAEAIANNEYERAAALLQEYQKAAESLVNVAKDQANLNVDIAGFNKDTHQYNQEMTLQKAQDMAKYGDFSGYLKLGFSSDQVNNMRRGWLALNPNAALYMQYH